MTEQPTPDPDTRLPRRRLLQAGIAGLGLAVAGTAAWFTARGEQPVADGEVLFDDVKYRYTDPRLVTYREIGQVATAMLKPRGLALAADGTLYVAGDRIIAVIAADGRRVADWACAGEPRALAVGPDGRLHVSLRDRIQTFTAGKAAPPGEPVAAEAVITGLAVHPSGDLYAADAGSRALWRFRDGKPCNRIGGEGDAEFIIPSPFMDVQVAPDGLVWVANTGRHRLEAYDQQDRRVRMWGVEGFAVENFSGCCNPADFAVMPDGRFITSEKGLPRVKRYTADGRFDSVVVPVDAFPGNPCGLDVAVATDGRVLVLDPASRKVRIFVEAERSA